MLGLYHEHARSDREEAIEVRLDQAVGDYVSALDKYVTDSLGVKYDYASVMHYNGRVSISAMQYESSVSTI